MFTSNLFESERKLYLKLYFYVKLNIRQNRERFTSINEAMLNKLSTFVAIIIEMFSV